MLWDTHMHTHHSGDSDALMPDMIQAAVRQNLDGICFTDHLIMITRMIPIYFFWILIPI